MVILGSDAYIAMWIVMLSIISRFKWPRTNCNNNNIIYISYLHRNNVFNVQNL